MLGGAAITERTREHAREMLLAGKRTASVGSATKSAASGGKGSPPARSGRAKSASGR
jgi:hypothetical protein